MAEEKSGGIVFNASKKRREDGVVLEQVVQGERAPVAKHTFHFPQSRIQEMKEMYSEVAVRDFGDDYHRSEEEKLAKFDLYNDFQKIQKHKTKYQNIVQYITAMRECLVVLEKLANKNRMLVKEDEFISSAISGKIEISGFQWPRYTGYDRKDINWEVVKEYILDSDLDPKELKTTKTIDFLDKEVEDDPVAYIKAHYTEEQQKIMLRKKSDRVNLMSYDEDIDGQDNFVNMTVLPMKKKEFKKSLKLLPDINRPIKNMLKSQEQMRGLSNFTNDFSYEINSKAMDEIRRLDKKKGYLSSDEMPKFSGHIDKKKDIDKYMYEMDEYELTHTYVPYNGQYIKLEDYKTRQLLETLESNNIDVKLLYPDTYEEKKRKRQDALDRKKEKKLRKKLALIQKRKNERHSGDPLINDKPKKKKKGKKKSGVEVSHDDNGVETWNWS